GVRHGIAVGTSATPTVRLCAALPQSLDVAVMDAFRSATEDLRGAVVDLVAQASCDVVLASPFWDGATLEEIGPVLASRLACRDGVRRSGCWRRPATFRASVDPASGMGPRSTESHSSEHLALGANHPGELPEHELSSRWSRTLRHRSTDSGPHEFLLFRPAVSVHRRGD